MKAKILIVISILIAGCSMSNMHDRNLNIVKSTYVGKDSKENAENLMSHLHENVVWIEADGFPLAGRYVGKESVKEGVFGRLLQLWSHYEVNIEHYVYSGDSVVALGTYSGVYRKTGKAFEARVAHHWTIKDGKIVAFEQFIDSVSVVEATY